MSQLKPLLCRLAVTAALFLIVGCPHRSPLWSPDGRRLLVLAGSAGEEVDKPASQLWLIEVDDGKSNLLAGPEKDTRFLAAAWIDNGSFLALTGQWDGEAIQEKSEKLWKRSLAGKEWQRLEAPQPDEARARRRLPVVMRGAAGSLLAYPTGAEQVTVVSLASGKKLLELDPAEVVGPGPQDGFLIWRPEEGDTGANELVAFGGDLKPLWKTRFSRIRNQIAARHGKEPIEVAFDDTSTSHLPPAGDKETDWVGITLMSSDPGWRDGIPGYYVRLAAKDGAVLGAAPALGLPGQPASAGSWAWGVTAPDAKKQIPAKLLAVDLETAKPAKELQLSGFEKEQVHGYSLDPQGKRLALSLNGAVPRVVIYPLEALETPRALELK
jgi:hypothetical protein